MQLKRFLSVLGPCVSLLIAMSSPVAAQSQVTLPSCKALFATVAPGFPYDGADFDAVRRGCKLTWIEKNTLQSLTWRYYANDFEPPIFATTADGGTVLISQQPPHLIDMDQDGTRDLLTFNRIGMVTGDFDIFLTDTDNGGFIHAGTVSGSYLSRDQDGTLVAEGRSGARAFFHFFKIEDQTVVPLFDVDPQDRCITTSYGNSWQPSAALIDHYCHTHEDRNVPERQGSLESTSQIAFVPTNTAFYCEMDTSKGRRAVTLKVDPNGLYYAFGAVAEDPELSLDRSWENVGGTGSHDTGRLTIELYNGAFTYEVYRDFDSNNAQFAGLAVRQNENADPVFDAKCDPNMTYVNTTALRR